MMIAGLVVVVVVGVRRGRRSVHACLHAVGDVDALMASVAEMVEIVVAVVVAVVMAVGRGFQAGGTGCGDFVGGAVECLLVGEMCRRGRCGLLLLLLLLVGCRRWEFVIRWAQAALGLLCLLFSDSLSALLGGLEV